MTEREIEGKTVKVFYEDGTQRVCRADGKCTSNNEENIVLDDKIIIPKKRIVRIEVCQ